MHMHSFMNPSWLWW